MNTVVSATGTTVAPQYAVRVAAALITGDQYWRDGRVPELPDPSWTDLEILCEEGGDRTNATMEEDGSTMTWYPFQGGKESGRFVRFHSDSRVEWNSGTSEGSSFIATVLVALGLTPEPVRGDFHSDLYGAYRPRTAFNPQGEKIIVGIDDPT
ncbi:MAG: hypothetical protein WAZ14_01570 [Patescibacteria group bacterium]